jgi:hypothetical protein
MTIPSRTPSIDGVAISHALRRQAQEPVSFAPRACEFADDCPF